MVLEESWFIEQSLPHAAISEADLDTYRATYPDPESRRPMLQWPREIPLDGEPADVRDRMLAYGRWLAGSHQVPKLLLTAWPGTLVAPEMVAWTREQVSALEVESVGAASHHAPEDRPGEIGDAVAGAASPVGNVEPGRGAGAVSPGSDEAVLSLVRSGRFPLIEAPSSD